MRGRDPIAIVDRMPVTTSNLATVDRFLDLLELHDLATIDEMWTEDAEAIAPYSPAGLPDGATGKDVIAAMFRQVFARYGRTELGHRRILATADPDVVVARWRADIDVVTSGGRYIGEVVAVFEFRDGSLARYTEYFDPTRLLAAG